MGSVVDRNVVMRRIPVYAVLYMNVSLDLFIVYVL
jgi:hypothetical protein